VAVPLQDEQLTVLQALALAGGLKDFADAKNIHILRRSNYRHGEVRQEDGADDQLSTTGTPIRGKAHPSICIPATRSSSPTRGARLSVFFPCVYRCVAGTGDQRQPGRGASRRAPSPDIMVTPPPGWSLTPAMGRSRRPWDDNVTLRGPGDNPVSDMIKRGQSAGAS